MTWTRRDRTTGDSRASRHAAAPPPPPPPSVPEAVAAPPCRVPPRRVCVCVCVPLLLAGAAIHPPDRQQLLLGRALRGAHLLGDPRFLRPRHLQGHVGPAHLCAGRRPKRQLATPERPLPLPSTTPTTQPPPHTPQALLLRAVRSTSSATSSAKRMRARSCQRWAEASCLRVWRCGAPGRARRPQVRDGGAAWPRLWGVVCALTVPTTSFNSPLQFSPNFCRRRAGAMRRAGWRLRIHSHGILRDALVSRPHSGRCVRPGAISSRHGLGPRAAHRAAAPR